MESQKMTVGLLCPTHCRILISVSCSISRIFAAADVPVIWDPVDVTPVRYPDGTMGIPKAVIESVNKHKVGLKSPLMTPVGKGFRSLNLALRKGDHF